jgi:cellulose synthase operon protein C
MRATATGSLRGTSCPVAVEASGSAPAETIRYAGVLVEDGRDLLAEELVIEALRVRAGPSRPAAALGDIYVRMEDWSRAEQVERSLRNRHAETAALADGLSTMVLTRGAGQTETWRWPILEELVRRLPGGISAPRSR